MKDAQRYSETQDFWKKREPNLHSMLLNRCELHDPDKEEVLQLLPCFKGKSVLDFAAGIGRFTKEFAKKAHRVTAVDFAPQMLQKNRTDNIEFTNIDYICSDAMDLSFPSHQFDLIFMSWLMIYLTDAEISTLSERMVRWLKPGGHLFFRESCAPTSRRAAHKNYYAHYRSMIAYNRLFDPHLTLLAQGNIQVVEFADANPFMCFWLYKLAPPESHP
jgi:phosphoethanolamine N-methyltransferase